MKQPKASQGEHGFTFIEVLVGMMIALIFVLIVTGGIAIATVYRVKAQRQSEALNAIQQDMEEVKFQAAKSLTGTCGTYGTALETLVDAIPLNNPRTLLKKPHILTRITTANGNTMRITYEVFPDQNEDGTADGDLVASLFTEVIPDASLKCDN